MNRFALALLVVAVAAGVPAVAQEAAPDAPLESLLSTPVSTAARYEQRLMDAAASVTVITAEEIERYGYETLAEALNSVRGMYLTYDRNYTYLGLRGFGRPSDYNNRFLVMINGHAINENVFGSAGIGTELPIDLADVDHIEVVRGPGSTLYGTGAMLGVINIFTRRSAGPVRAELSVGSAGRRGAAAAFSTEFGATALRLSVTGRKVDGEDLTFPEYRTGGSDGVARNLDDDASWSVLGTLAHRDLTVTAYAAHRLKGIPTGSFDTLFNQRSETDDGRRFIDAVYAPRLNAHTALETRLSWDSYHYDGVYPYDDGRTGDQSRSVQFSSEMRLLFDPYPNQRVTLGVQHVENRVARYDINGTGTNGAADLSSIYTQYEYQPLENVRLIGGLRYDAQHGYRSRTTPRAAVIYNPRSTTSLKLLYGKAFRLPTPWERDYDDPAEGYKANLDLRDEKIRTLEMVWEEQLSPEVSGTVSLYDFRMSDLIDPRVDAAGVNQFVNGGDVSSHGVELELTRRAGSGVWTYVHYALQHADATDARLTNSPLHVGAAGVSGPLGASLTGGVDLVLESPRLTLAGARTDAIFLCNGVLSGKLTPQWKLVAQIRNVFDAAYAHPGGVEHRQDSIPQDGRTFALRLIYTH